MTTYIALGNWTDQGARNIAESPRRLDSAKRELEEMGGRFTAFYMTMGEHDLVLIYEAPDDAVAARFLLVLGRLGAVRTKTLRAFPEAAYRQIIASGSEGIAQGRLASVLDIQHSLISYHLQPLLAAGLATVEKRGREMIYRADPIRLNRLAASILDLSSGDTSHDQ